MSSSRREAVGEVVDWLREPVVSRAAVLVGVATVGTLALCASRIEADGTAVAATEVVLGHRYALGPLVVLAMVAGGCAGSVAARTPARTPVRTVIVGAVGAATWFALVGAAMTGAALATVSAVGGVPGVHGADLAAGAALLVRLAPAVAGTASLAALAGAAGWPPEAAAAVGSLVVIVAELAMGVAASGRIPLFLGGTFAVAAAGQSQTWVQGLPAWAVPVIVGVCWVALPVVSVAGAAVLQHRRAAG